MPGIPSANGLGEEDVAPYAVSVMRASKKCRFRQNRGGADLVRSRTDDYCAPKLPRWGGHMGNAR